MNCVEQTEIVASSFIMTTLAVTQHVKPLIFLSSNNVELMTHCPYSPNLSSNDFFLFPYIKNKMRGERFETWSSCWNISYTDIWGYSLEWKKCFENWFERMQKYIDLKGEYLKKQ